MSRPNRLKINIDNDVLMIAGGSYDCAIAAFSTIVSYLSNKEMEILHKDGCCPHLPCDRCYFNGNKHRKPKE